MGRRARAAGVVMLRWQLPWFGEAALLLAEIELSLELAGLCPTGVLLRASEVDALPQLQAHGTDRAGFVGDKPWRHNAEEGCALRHEDVVLATTVVENRLRDASSSLSKIAEIEAPLVLAYDRGHLRRLRDTHWAFRDPASKREALRVIATVTKHPPIPGWFSASKGLAYRALVAAIEGPDARVVEIGCWCGSSTSYIARLCQQRGIALACVDTWAGSCDRYAGEYRRLLAEHDIAAAFLETMRRLDASPQILRMDSWDAARHFDDGSVDLVFIDGSHDLQSVRADIAAWLPKVRGGGSLAGDDYTAAHPGVCSAVDEAAARLHGVVEHPAAGLWRLRAPQAT